MRLEQQLLKQCEALCYFLEREGIEDEQAVVLLTAVCGSLVGQLTRDDPDGRQQVLERVTAEITAWAELRAEATRQ